MEDAQNLTTAFAEKLKPYGARIAHLESLEHQKQSEIDAMKLLVKDLHYLLEDLKADKQLNGKA